MIQNIDKNQLVIYYEQKPPLPGRSVRIDKFTLISSWAGAAKIAAKALDATQKVGDIAVNAKELTSKPTAPAAPAPPAPTEPSVAQEYAGAVQAKLIVVTDDIRDLPAVTDERIDQPWNPLTDRVERQTITYPDGSKVTITTQTPSKLRDLLGAGDRPRVSVVPTPAQSPTVVDQPAPDKPRVPAEPTPAQSPTVVDQPARRDAKVIDHDDEDKFAPPDPRVGDSQADAAFLDLMDRVNTMTFSSPASQAAHLEAEMKKARIRDPRASSLGTGAGPENPMGTDPGPKDPLGIQDHLRSTGVPDEKLLARALEEANSAVRAFEACVRECQADLAGLDPEINGYTDRLNAKLRFWDGELKSRLSANPPGDAGAAWRTLDVVDGVASVVAPGAGSSQAHSISPSGLLIRAGMGNVRADQTSIAMPFGSIEPGHKFNATPFVSLLEEDAWKTRA